VTHGQDARAGCFSFELCRGGQSLGRVELRVPGRHNVLNALAAAALTAAVGTAPADIVAGLSGFAGLKGRLETLGTVGGIAVVDDYAHHPTQAAAALDAVRRMFPGRRVWCVFQPHQASRTARLLDELAASLQNADMVMVAEVFRAREGPPQPGEATAADLYRRATALGARGVAGHTFEEITATLETRLLPGDVLVTLGAGDIGRIGHGFLERFREDRAAG
jgi:UDP-N-acetylmuramate--alanine ligase